MRFSVIRGLATRMVNGNLRTAIAKYFRQGAFLRNFSIVMSGTAFAQLIGFALMPVVSRLFTPSDFGIFGSYNSVLAVFSAFVTLQYNQAIVLSERTQDAINLFFVSCISVALVTGLCALLALVFPEQAQGLIEAPNRWFPLLLAVSVLVAGLNQSLQSWCIRVKAFTHTSASPVIRSLSAAGIWIATGIGHAGAVGLVLGSICAEVLSSLNLGRVLKRDLKETSTFVNWAKMKKLARDFRDFPTFAAPQNLMNALSQGLPVLLMSHFYGIGIAGAYAFSVRILHAPTRLVLTPMRQVLFQKASETQNQGGDLYPLFLKITGGLMAVAIVPSVILFIWAPQIFSWIFGREWIEAGIYARWLMLWIFAGFSNMPSVVIMRILRQQQKLLMYECIILLSRTIILIVGGVYWQSLTTVISFSILGIILNIVLILWVGTFIRKNNSSRL